MGSKSSPKSKKAESHALKKQGTGLRKEPWLLVETAEEVDTALDLDYLKDQVLEILLEGDVAGPKMIARKLGIDSNQFDTIIPIIREILWDPDFQRKLMLAKKDPTISGIDRIKKKTHKFIRNMEDLADQAIDLRVKLVANQDLLNRAGTAPSQRVEVGPAAYFKALEGLIESVQSGNKDQSEGIVPEAPVHPEGVAGGSGSGN
jgi:hypothetical protein